MQRQGSIKGTKDLRLLVLADAGSGHGCLDLDLSGFECTYVRSVGDAVRQILSEPPDATLAVLAEDSAAQLCEVLRALGRQPLVVAGQGLSPEVAADCLDRGCDAVVALPLPACELAARIRAVCQRAAQELPSACETTITTGALVMNMGEHSVCYRGKRIDLSPTEFNVLAVLAERRGGVVTNRELLAKVWGDDYVDDLHYVRLYIGYLRSKFEDDPRNPELLLNQWGVGYRLAVQELELEPAL